MADWWKNLPNSLDDLNLPDFNTSQATGGFKISNIGWPDSTGLSADAVKANAGSPSDWQMKWLGGVDGATGTRTNGILPVGAAALTGLASSYLGFQQLNLAKQQLSQNKKVFNLNFQTQAANVNRDLEDRQRARVASNAGAYDSVDSYMSKNGIKAKGI